jgi:hypothetical protein
VTSKIAPSTVATQQGRRGSAGLQTIRLKSISRSRSARSYKTFLTFRLPSASWTRGSSLCWVSRSIMSSDRFRYSAACWRVSSLGPGGAQDGESCVRAAGRAGGTRTCVRWGSQLSPGLSPLGFARGRPGRRRRRWLAVAKGNVVAASSTGVLVRRPACCAVPAMACGAADSAGSCAADIAASRFATIRSPPPQGGHILLLSGHRGNCINNGAQSFRVKYLYSITTSPKYLIWPPLQLIINAVHAPRTPAPRCGRRGQRGLVLEWREWRVSLCYSRPWCIDFFS